MSIVFVSALLLAAPEDCSRARVSEAFNAGQYARAEKIALGGAAQDPIYYFLAAQAQGELRKWTAQRKALKTFLAQIKSSDPNRAEAKSMLARCEKEIARQQAATKGTRPDKPAEPKPPGSDGEKSPEQPPPEEQPPDPAGEAKPAGPEPNVTRPAPSDGGGATSGDPGQG